MSARLQRILEKLAQQHAPHIIGSGWDKLPGDDIGRIQQVARRLAEEGLLVVAAQVPPALEHLKQIHIQDWVRGYNQMYMLLARRLFPSYATFNAYYADDRMPPIAVLEGEAIAVTSVIAGVITPYLGLRQAHQQATMLELRGLMEIVLDALEAHDLHTEDYTALHNSGVTILQQMLNATVQHVSLTAFDKNVLQQLTLPVNNGASQAAAPVKPKAPPPGNPEQERLTYTLEQLPEDDQEPTITREMFIERIPFGPTPRTRGDTSPLPPVPPIRNKNAGR